MTLRERRKAAEITQAQLAGLANVSVDVVRKYEQTNRATNSPEYKRVIHVIEELERKRKREEHPARELREAMERAIAELRAQPNDPEIMALISKLEGIYPEVCVMQGIEEPSTLEETNNG